MNSKKANDWLVFSYRCGFGMLGLEVDNSTSWMTPDRQPDGRSESQTHQPDPRWITD